MRDRRSHNDDPGTTKPLASSETPRVTTETTMGSRAGENSKQSFPHCNSSIHNSSTPASNVALKPTVARALSRKSPAGGAPSRVAAFSVDSASSVVDAPGSMKRSVRRPAVATRELVCSSNFQAPAGDDESGNGTPGMFTRFATSRGYDNRAQP